MIDVLFVAKQPLGYDARVARCAERAAVPKFCDHWQIIFVAANVDLVV